MIMMIMSCVCSHIGDHGNNVGNNDDDYNPYNDGYEKVIFHICDYPDDHGGDNDVDTILPFNLKILLSCISTLKDYNNDHYLEIYNNDYNHKRF